MNYSWIFSFKESVYIFMMFHNKDINIKIFRSNRKTISIEIKNTELVVRAPLSMNDRDIYNFIDKKKNWIEKNLNLILKRQEDTKNIKPYTNEEIRELADKALIVIPQKVSYYAGIIGVDYGRITIRNQRTRWGSCSGKGNLNFNCLLMLMPDEVIDSVVVHELCHRKHMNHSKSFYAEVEKVFPKYKECQKWLKENGSLFLSRLP